MWSSKWNLTSVEDKQYILADILAFGKYIESNNFAILSDKDFLWLYSSSQCIDIMCAVFSMVCSCFSCCKGRKCIWSQQAASQGSVLMLEQQFPASWLFCPKETSKPAGSFPCVAFLQGLLAWDLLFAVESKTYPVPIKLLYDVCYKCPALFTLLAV